MDSKNIYISSKTYLTNVVWTRNNSETEWIYIGNNSLNILQILNNFFKGELQFYFVKDRHNSIQTDKEFIFENIKDNLEKNDFLIWNLEFNKVIEFSKIGVYRIGKYQVRQ